MFTVAIIGADGAGKTTVTHQVLEELPLPAKHVYMGVNLENSKLVLPTTRLLLEVKRLRGKRPDMAGPPDPTRRKAQSKNLFKRILSEVKTGLRMANLMSEEWFRQAVISLYKRRGNVVLFDRHFFIDYYAHDIAGGKGIPLANRVHGLMLKYLYPRPDMVIMLDAPPEVLFERKGEGTIELLERRRQEYLQFGEIMNNFHVVDATQPLNDVVSDVSSIIQDFHARHKKSST